MNIYTYEFSDLVWTNYMSVAKNASLKKKTKINTGKWKFLLVLLPLFDNLKISFLHYIIILQAHIILAKILEHNSMFMFTQL